MAIARKTLLPLSGEQTVLISCTLARTTPPFTLDGRELIRQLIQTDLKTNNLEILAWCIMPTSYRIILRTQQGYSSQQSELLNPLTQFIKPLNMQISAWVSYCSGVKGGIWKNRYASSPLSTPGEELAATISVIAFPMLTHITDEPDDYYFTSYYHACQGDKYARRGLATLIGLPGKPWSQVKRRLLKQFKDLEAASID